MKVDPDYFDAIVLRNAAIILLQHAADDDADLDDFDDLAPVMRHLNETADLLAERAIARVRARS